MQPVTDAPPPLSVAGSWGAAEIALARRFDQLHQLIYTRGGIRPSGAAVEEVAKLVLIRLWSLRDPAASLASGRPARELFATADGDVALADFAPAFAAALADPSLCAVDPAGRCHPVWRRDEPFRLANASVLAAAAGLVADIVPDLGGTGLPRVADPLGTAFDALLAGRYDHAGGLGTYLTPSGVARMMAQVAVELLDPAVLERGAVHRGAVHNGPTFGDPYCGTGRFLVALLALLRETGGTVAARLLEGGAFGCDQSAAAVAKARINLLLYGVTRPLVWTVSDSVTDEALGRYAGSVPLVLTNPPFGEGKYDDPAGISYASATLPRLAGRARIDPSLACLVRAVALLAPGGVLGIVLPDGVVASATFADLLGGRDSRQESLFATGAPEPPVSLAACVSLPKETFSLGGTVARTSAVFLVKQGRPSYVALARAAKVGYLRRAGKAGVDPAGNDLPALPALIRNGLARCAAGLVSADPLVVTIRAGAVDPARLDPAQLDLVKLAPAQSAPEGTGAELLGATPVPGAELLGATPVPGAELLGATPVPGADLAGGVTVRPVVRMRSLLAVRRPVRSREVASPFISVLHIDDLGTVDWPAARSYHPTTPGVVAQAGDLIVSLLNPAHLRAAVIPEHYPQVHISSEFGVFRATGDPYTVLAILYSPPVREQLRPLGSGTSSSRRRIAAEDVLNVVLPQLSEVDLDKLGTAVRESVALVDTGRERLAGHYTTLGYATLG